MIILDQPLNDPSALYPVIYFLIILYETSQGIDIFICMCDEMDKLNWLDNDRSMHVGLINLIIKVNQNKLQLPQFN